MSIINIIVTDHNKSSKNLKSILSDLEEMNDLYGEYIKIYFISSQISNEDKSLVLKCDFIESYFVNNNFKKFEKLKYLFDEGHFSNDDFICVVDADDKLLTKLFSNTILTLLENRPDIAVNTVFKVDPTLWGDEIKYLNWSGVSSNTIYKASVLGDYFKFNEHFDILSEDNVRHLYALSNCKKIIRYDSPFYLGVRWWEGESISNSSILNSKDQYDDSISSISELNRIFGKGLLKLGFQNKDSKKWGNQKKMIRYEYSAKIDSIFRESILEALKKNILLSEHFSLVKSKLSEKKLLSIFKKNTKKYVMWAWKEYSSINNNDKKSMSLGLFKGKYKSLEIIFDSDKMEVKYD